MIDEKRYMLESLLQGYYSKDTIAKIYQQNTYEDVLYLFKAVKVLIIPHSIITMRECKIHFDKLYNEYIKSYENFYENNLISLDGGKILSVKLGTVAHDAYLLKIGYSKIGNTYLRDTFLTPIEKIMVNINMINRTDVIEYELIKDIVDNIIMELI